MIFNFIIESYLKHLLFYFQTFLHTLIKDVKELLEFTGEKAIRAFLIGNKF